jgi:hypothetical protein
MKLPKIAFLFSLAALLVATIPARADQVVYFVNGKAMTVKNVERGDRVTVLEIEGGGRIGVPSVQIDRIEDLQLSAPAAATAAIVAPPPAPAPAPVQPVANPQANVVVPANPVAPAVAAAVPAAAVPSSGVAVDPKTGLPMHGPGRPGGPLTEEALEGGPPRQALPPAYNPGAARGGQYGAQAGVVGVGGGFNNNANGVIGRPDGPGRRFNARLGAFGRVRPPVSAPPPTPPGQGQAPANQGAAPPASAPSDGSAAAKSPPAPPQPPPANPEPPADNTQNDQGAENGSSNPPPPDDPAPNDPPADDNPPDGEN